MSDEYLKPDIKKSRKLHQCCECLGTIKIAESYYRYVSFLGTAPKRYKVCSDCEKLRAEYVSTLNLMYDEVPLIGGLRDDILDNDDRAFIDAHLEIARRRSE